MSEGSTCTCGHAEASHKWEPGFYDVRGHYAECNRIGCPCTKYEWNGKRPVAIDRGTGGVTNAYKAQFKGCCEAGKAAWPEPCPWHGPQRDGDTGKVLD